jgi:PAS domain S-box-containing protein
MRKTIHRPARFYESDESLCAAIGRYVAAGLDAGDHVFVFATPELREGVVGHLGRHDGGRALADGRLFFWDARATLARFMVKGRPDAALFQLVLDDAVTRATRGHPGVSVRAYDAMIDLLWRDGERSAAIALEELWSEASSHSTGLSCAYAMANFFRGGDGEGVEDGPVSSGVEGGSLSLRERVRSLEVELQRSREVERAVRDWSSEKRAATEVALRAADVRFHHLVDAVTDYAIFMLDPTGHVATWNSGAKRIKGYDAHEIVGQHLSIFYPREDRADGKPERILDTVRREGRYAEEGWRVRKDGSKFWAGIVITTLRDASGKVTGFAKVTRDLTSRRAAEERERALAREQLARAISDDERHRLMTVLQQVPAVVNFFRGPNFVCDFVHPKTQQAAGGRDLRGRPLLEVMPECRDRPHHVRLRRVFETGEPDEERESPGWSVVDGRRVETYASSFYLPIRDAFGAIDGVMTFELDVTDSVSARRELEAAGRAKDDFLATMSHELRSPLNAILGWASILLHKTHDEAKLAHGLEVIERNAHAQERLVGDLLDMSRIVSGKLRLSMRRMDVGAVVRAAADVVRPAAESKGVMLALNLDPSVGFSVGDPDRIQQVVWNLLTNAVRYTPRGGAVEVTGERASGGISIRVTDTGAGIPREHLPYVFDRFRQVDNTATRQHGGLGLGLAIVRHLVEAHGGSVEVESAGAGRGATFSVRLPVPALDGPPSESEDAAPSAPPPSGEGALRGLSILVVDDDPDSLEIVGLALSGAGARVTTAKSAHEALGSPGPFDVIVSDVAMPGMDGYAFVRTIRSRDTGCDVAAIALTAYARDVDAERALRAGFQEHLAKPVDARKLIDSVETWAKIRSFTAAERGAAR